MATTAIVRAPCVALVVDEGTAARLWCERQDAEYRARATPHVCQVACMAAIEGAQQVARRMVPILDDGTARRLERDLTPSYVWMRNFLVGELGADYVLACATAFSYTALEARLGAYLDEDRVSFGTRGERGWI